ncbi:MAG: diacylglycerol kinase [Candidatus Omnitrophica bacterium]|nr:diacylglycerol kinase [Candidatus Omnitrophota bacterium]MDD4013131.1 diacylglycerol kinase [Candidatus Omnitrophota bacterium]
MNSSKVQHGQKADERRFVDSVNAALEGVVHTLKSERNMRVHFGLAILALISGLYFDLGPLEMIALCFAVAFVLVSEMMNTALEHAVDMMNDEYHPLAKLSKDVAAGAVFVSAVNAVITGYILFSHKLSWGFSNSFVRIKQSPGHMTLIALLAVVGMVLFVKILGKAENLLRGGMPSGHTAVAFAIWVAVSLLTANGMVSVLVLLMAVLIARGRLTNGIHNIWEIIAGAGIGALLTLLIFQVIL